MRAELYDIHGNPVYRARYDHPFELFWRGVGYGVLGIFGAALAFFFLSIVFEASSEQRGWKARVDLTTVHSQGLHLYIVDYAVGKTRYVARNTDEARLRVSESYSPTIISVTPSGDDEAALRFIQSAGVVSDGHGGYGYAHG